MQETVIVILTFTWLLVSALTGIPGPFGPDAGEPYLDEMDEDETSVPAEILACDWEIIPWDWLKPDPVHIVEPPRERDDLSCYQFVADNLAVEREEDHL